MSPQKSARFFITITGNKQAAQTLQGHDQDVTNSISSANQNANVHFGSILHSTLCGLLQAAGGQSPNDAQLFSLSPITWIVPPHH